MTEAQDIPTAPEARFDTSGSRPQAARRAATFLKTLAHEGRLEILCLLIEGERTVGELEEALDMPQAKVSQLLMRLRSEGIVEARREGRNVLYRLEKPEIIDIIAVLRRTFCAS